jgi:acetyl esterase/lipase
MLINPLITLGRKTLGGGNSFFPLKEIADRSDKTLTFISNVEYGKKYPNSFFDLYSSDNDFTNPKPVMIYLHGGGYIWGDKYVGDPFVKSDGKGMADYFKPFLDMGLRVVSLNHALSPEYRYPIPVYQIDHAVHFLKKHGAEYGIDMRQVVFGGGSAGGQLAGQYVNIQTNDVYAKEMKMERSLEPGCIKAVVFASALLDMIRFDKTGASVDRLFRLCARAYYGRKDFDICNEAWQANVITYITKKFPPSFISDGNTGTFTEQAKDLSKTMENYGIRHELVIFPVDEVKLSHGYESDMSNEYAQETSKKAVSFLENILK